VGTLCLGGAFSRHGDPALHALAEEILGNARGHLDILVEIAKNHVKMIERSGGHVLAGVCTVVSWTEALGIKTIMTNSAKTAYYAPTLNKAATILATKEECLKTALRQ
jgi:predicted aconitase